MELVFNSSAENKLLCCYRCTVTHLAESDVDKLVKKRKLFYILSNVKVTGHPAHSQASKYGFMPEKKSAIQEYPCTPSEGVPLAARAHCSHRKVLTLSSDYFLSTAPQVLFTSNNSCAVIFTTNGLPPFILHNSNFPRSHNNFKAYVM